MWNLLYKNEIFCIIIIVLPPAYPKIVSFQTQQLESNEAEVREELLKRHDFCPDIAFYSQCELEVLRQKVYVDGVVSHESNPQKVCDQSIVSSYRVFWIIVHIDVFGVHCWSNYTKHLV